MAGAGTSTRADEGSEPGRVQFDIPAQPLISALNAYCAAAGIEMFADTDQIAGRRSAGVQGAFTRESALQSLLSGTGLAARFVGDSGFTLVALPPPPQADAGTQQRLDAYSALLQAALRRALCRYDETRPGAYRFLGRLWISAPGTIFRTELITSTGNVIRDAMLLRALQGAVLGEAPPPDLPQPVTVLLAADPALAAGYCTRGDAGRPGKASAEGRE